MSNLKSLASGVHVPSAASPTEFDDYVVPEVVVPGAGVFFFDDFRNATVGELPYQTLPVIHPSGGKWKVGREVYITDERSLTHGKSVAFRYPTMNSNGYSYSELPYQFYGDIGHAGPDVWCRMELYIPDNYYNPSLSEWEALGFTQRNNKGPLLIRGEPNQTVGGLAQVHEMWIGPSTNAGENYGRVMLYTSDPRPDNYLPQNSGKFFRVQDKGTWISYIVHTKLESAYGAGDGLWQEWIIDGDGVQRELMNYPAENYHTNTFGWNNGYLMGWANVGYFEPTTFYLDSVTFSTDSLL